MANTQEAPKRNSKATSTSTSKTRVSRTRSAKKTTSAKSASSFKQQYAADAAPTLEITNPEQFGRVVVMNIVPSPAQGVFAPRVALGEDFTVRAQVFMEGRTKVGATVVLRNPRGREMARVPMQCTNPGLDSYQATLRAGETSNIKPWQEGFSAVKRQLGAWSFTVEGWQDPYTLWLHDARIKVENEDDLNNILEQGAQLLSRWHDNKPAKLNAQQKKQLKEAVATLRNSELSPAERLAGADNETIAMLHETNPLRDAVSQSPAMPLTVERPAATFSAWYQFFPRSEGAYVDEETGNIVQGTLVTSVSGLERAAAQGFDIVYLPPIFPIGVTNRKGRNNTLVAGPTDPGSPFGIGSELGGHDTVDPLLGTMDDFRALTARAHELGLEVALDFALQCSPDHPWVKQHPNWFMSKPDGTIAFAENPPKKYQDIYPIDFNADMPGIEREVERIMNLWIDAGVTIFRVDNPHTKPVRFWQDVIAAVTKKHPEVLFLAEAFTRPGMMRALSYAGFTQSHCYFPWRNTKEELDEYLLETNGNAAFWQHNTFWPTTPDILTAYVRDNGIAGHAVRAVLAALGSPSWGIYNGYELIENQQRPGVEEQIDNEKYEIKVRDWSKASEYGIAELLTALNRIRRAHPAAQSYHNVTLLESSDPSIVAFARRSPAAREDGSDDVLLVIVNLDGHNTHQANIHIDLEELGLPTNRTFVVHDELTGRRFEWGSDNFVSLAPWADVAHVLSVEL